jgi:uncharacterized protein YegJ (DUF2314 family)
MSWNQRSSNCSGAVFFRGSLTPRADEFAHLAAAGIAIKPVAAAEHELWALQLTHSTWGEARLAAPRHTVPVPKVLVKFDARLDETDKTEALLGQSSVQLKMSGEKNDVLRDRKRLLRFFNAVMGDDGLIALDATAMRFWSRAALADELCHDADLDIDSLFTIHAIRSGDEKNVNWFHTHGLAEIGFFDFDIVRPSLDLLTSRCHDFSRAVAFSIVEGKVEASTPLAKITSSGPIRLVDVAEFNRRASKADRDLRDADDLHNRNRTVLCDPAGRRWISRLVGIPAHPSRLLSAPQGDFMVFFPANASRLMTERARRTYGMFRELTAEFAEIKAKPIVKLGYPVEGGGKNDLEHMWFEVHSLNDETIDATLVNKPRNVPTLMQGQRGLHPLERLTDWMLLGPTGSITPRDTRPARTARLNREKILKLLEKRG